MILLINTELITEYDVGTHFYKLCKLHSIFYTTIDNQIIVPPQKITLCEIDMNHIFAEVFVYFDYELTYGNLGGFGCDFSLEMIQKIEG
jgi:hypothetical protein